VMYCYALTVSAWSWWFCAGHSAEKYR